MEDVWIEVGELLRATGMSERKRAFIRWRDAGLIPRPETQPQPGGGSVSKYPPASIAQMSRVQELENDKNVPRRIDAWLLIMWTEGWTVDVGPALTRRFDKLLVAMADEKAGTIVEAISAKKVKGLRGGKQRLLKRMMARVGDLEEWAALVSLIYAVAAGTKSDVSLRDHDIQPAPLAALLKVAGLPKDWGAPADNFSIDDWASTRSLVTFLREVAVQLSENANEMERLRDVFARLARLAAALEGLPLAALPRHARRTLVKRGITITQDTIALLLDLWRDIDIRLMLVPGFILILRAAGETVDGLLSLAEATVAQLPKRAPESSERKLTNITSTA